MKQYTFKDGIKVIASTTEEAKSKHLFMATACKSKKKSKMTPEQRNIVRETTKKVEEVVKSTGLQEDNNLLNDLNKQVTASKGDTMKNKYQFNGEVITASCKQEAIKVFAEKEAPSEKYDKICKEIADLEKSTSPKFDEVEDDTAVGEVQLGNRLCLEYTLYVTGSGNTNPKICVKVELGRILSRHTVVIYRRAIKAKSVEEAVAFITNCIDNAKPLAKPLASFEEAINSKKFKDWES